MRKLCVAFRMTVGILIVLVILACGPNLPAYGQIWSRLTEESSLCQGPRNLMERKNADPSRKIYHPSK